MITDTLDGVLGAASLIVGLIVVVAAGAVLSVAVIEPSRYRLIWWWKLRRTQIITVSMTRLDLSTCWDYNFTNNRYFHQFTPDVSYWCRHNLKSEYGCIPRDNVEIPVIEIEDKSFYFRDPNDAFLFKMKWL